MNDPHGQEERCGMVTLSCIGGGRVRPGQAMPDQIN